MNRYDSRDNLEEWDAFFNQLNVDLTRLHNQLAAIEARLQNHRLGGQLPKRPPGGAVSRSRGSGKQIPQRSKEPRKKTPGKVRRQSAVGAKSFRLKRLHNGRAEVCLNDVNFGLSPVLAELLAFLAAGSPATPAEAFVEFKPMEAIGAHMAQRHQRPFNEHAIRQAIWRLRGVLMDHKLDSDLVETCDAGARLAWCPTNGNNAAGEERRPPSDD